jgi:histidine ammonia-lyase
LKSLHKPSVPKGATALGSGKLAPARLWEIASLAVDPSAKPQLAFENDALARIQSGADFIDRVLAAGDRVVYGLNTGFGHFAERSVPPGLLSQLQRNLILSHACAVGPLAPREIVMAMWLLRLHTFAKGHSGIGLDTIGAVLALLNAGVLGLVPSRGSVGASGDLVAAAHASLVLLGEGKCSRPGHNGSEFEVVDSSRALAEMGLQPLSLRPKEGLSLINGGHFTAALATKAWYEARKLFRTANLTAAMNMEAMGGAGTILEAKVLATHHPHTRLVGHEMAQWLEGSQFLLGARHDKRFFQAPYCLRCAPQVHGAVAAELDGVENTLRDDYETVSDNPLVFPESEEIHSCGNFHAIYAARASDKLASAITTLGNISERRINMAMDERLSGLPGFLVHNGGLNSGLMMVQVTAAALVSECKSLSFPASVDSIPTNCDREDHVSMGPIAGHKALAIIEHVRNILAIELLVAAQALDLRGTRVQMPPAIRRVHSRLREHVDFVERDRVLAPDIETISRLIDQEALF